VLLCAIPGESITQTIAEHPRGTKGENDGYLAIYAFDPEKQASDLVPLDAAHIDAARVAVIRLPQRVPQGLHGNGMPKA